MRIGLFTEQDFGTQGSLASTVDALVAYRPRDVFIHRYAAPPNLAVALMARELVRRAQADRLDLVHLAATGPVALIALLVASRLSVPVIGSFPHPTPPVSRVFTIYVRALIARSRRLLVTSVTARDTLLRDGIGPSKIVVWRPGVDTSTFTPLARSSAIRERWGVSDARPAVIYAGALSDARGAMRLLSMEAALHRTRPMHRLIVAGDGPSRNGLQARCPNAVFLGTVPRAAMPEVLASADLFVCPNEASSSNLALLEAQASGLPIVVMEDGSARERGTDATSIVCRSQADFIVETAALVRTDGRRTRMGLAAREHALRQLWGVGLTSVYAEYRAAAAASRVRRDLEPAFAPQSRRL